VTHLELDALPRAEAFRLLEASACGARVDSAVADRVYALTQGNPLFATELLAHWEACAVVERRGGAIVRGPAWRDAGLPQRFRDLVAMRLLELDEEERALLDAAAVDGVRFDGEALAAISGGDLLPVLRLLQRISRQRGLISPAPDGYRFTTAVTQEVIYGELAPELRRALHLALAKHLEGRQDVRPERLGHHWLRGGRPEQARPHLLQALVDAADRQESHRAVGYAREIELLGKGHSGEQLLEEQEAVTATAACLHNMGRSDEAIAMLERLGEAAAAAGDELRRLKCGVRIESMRYFTDGAAAVDRDLLARAADELPACFEQGRAHYQLGVIHKYADELEEAERRLRAADSVFVDEGLAHQHASTLDQIASVASRAGRLEEAERLYGEAAELCRRHGRRVNAAVSDINGAQIAFSRGRIEGIPTRLIPSLDYLKLEGAQNLLGQGQVMLARVYDALGDREAAMTAVDDALAAAETTRYLPALFAANLEKAHLLGVGGDLERAWAHLELASAYARESGRVDDLLGAECLRILLLCWQDRREQAAEAFDAVEPKLREHRSSIPFDLLAIATLFGLPPDRAGSIPTEEDEPVDRALLLAAREYASGGSDLGALREAADLLCGDDVGEHRAMLRVLADLFEARFATLGHNPQVAAGAAASAEAGAAALGHHWLASLARDALPDS
jgi:tetratricopeptide (TPR) repeat protein